jgi:ABC-type glycerol-3-phosphate transport system substrate-binding protein
MKITKFQIITLGLFLIFLVAGVAAFALYKGDNSSTTIPTVTFWGTFPADTFNSYVAKVNSTLVQPITVNYVQKSQATFSQEFIAALARGQGPDGILIPADVLLPHYDKLSAIPFTALPQRTFIDNFIEEGTVYLNASGLIAIPFTVDPLVMYWNRDTFNAAGIAAYPKYWDEFTGLNAKLTTKDANGNIRKSAIALGDFSNVGNAREIMASLIMQVGNPITRTDKDGFIQSTLKPSLSVDPTPAVNYFTQFVDPASTNYSWNRGMPPSKSAFLSGSLATYFGFASELNDIRNKNQNINFDVAPLPQLRSGGLKAGYARMNGFSIVRTSANPNAVFQVISILTDPANISQLNEMLYLPTVRRDVIAQGSSDPYITIFNQAALISKTWLDADPAKSRDIFGRMIEAITSGAKTIYQAIQDAGDEYDIILRQALATVGAPQASLLASVGDAPPASPVSGVQTRTLQSELEPSTNPNSSAFKVAVCDGPTLPTAELIANAEKDLGGRKYVPCDFNAVMLLVQHLINIMLVIGVLAAIVMFAYAGLLFVSGQKAKIDKARSIFPKVFVGFIIMLSAWFIVYQILSWLTDNSGFKTLLGQ